MPGLPAVGLDASHGVVAGLVVVAVALSRSLYTLIQRKQWESGGRPERRKDDSALTELKASVALLTQSMQGLQDTARQVRQDIHSLRDSLQPVITRVAVLETRVTHLETER